MTALWVLWAIATAFEALFAALWISTLKQLHAAEAERDELMDRLIFAAPTSFRDVPVRRSTP